jgi:cyclopropane-fatty-acyl-phospholipid synthase
MMSLRDHPLDALGGERRSPGARRRWRDPRVALLSAIGGRLRIGQLTVETPGGERLVFAGREPGPGATLLIRRWRVLRRLLLGGDIGFAEAYMDGDWSTPGLVELMELAARNETAIGQPTRGVRLARLVHRLRHLSRANTRRGSRRNIAAHYDLGNDFYARWLDRGMTYSSAVFAEEAMSLEAAQAAKYARVAALLGLEGGERVLEIGCGWGGMVEWLAARHRCHVTALTLSRQQLVHAARRVADGGFAGRAEIRLQDYRDVDGVYDRIVSIEMLEAVGEAHWRDYFRVLRDRLVPGGVAVLQVITIADARYAAYRAGADFIQRYVFPGGMLPSPQIMRDQVAAAGLTLAHVETFGDSYRRTLAQWQARFAAAWPDLAALGLGERFKRMWEYYLAYCEAGFRVGAIDVGFYRVEKRWEG